MEILIENACGIDVHKTTALTLFDPFFLAASSTISLTLMARLSSCILNSTTCVNVCNLIPEESGIRGLPPDVIVSGDSKISDHRASPPNKKN